mmetsp:Transcript_23340/g.38893  ORF Transcript_23340/g.38893 Transcript_23340/m.38893 type:complete len:210 (-) Transcript_23340:115-744(-)|eukprot:CAMPEP_0174953818 /NCGR_PEP_ID=MMETSP0004_2-20121128/71_1 /TAXON_ID=420556 /ORGANISM="Ochromonas sp., Strain CCMP1393" /LENGTH=209 /DNA_ID=CAMNT_0016201545 /DNA_START=40 /DNA_END=669 /DNA_ORIENTATION=+
MFKTIIAASLLASTAAFSMPAGRMTSSRVSMSAEGLVGSLPPVGFFDPLSLSEGKTDAEMKKIREAELKHGRVAMVAALGILTGEATNPLFDGKITGPAIYQFQQADDLVRYFWVGVLFFIALIEGQNILSGWESPAEASGKGVADLKEDYINGDLGFDPLSLMPEDEEAFDTMRTKELQNGRLAMLGVAGMVAQELVNGKGIFENLFA